MKKNYYRVILLIAAFQFLCYKGYSQTLLTTVTTDTGSVHQPPDSTIVKSINIKFNNASFLNKELNQLLIIDLPEPGGNIQVRIQRTREVENPNYNSYSWYGKLQNEPRSFVLITQVNNKVSGYIRRQNNQIYKISYIGNNLHKISKINQKYFKPDRSDVPNAALLNNRRSAEGICYDTTNVIDVLVCYTVAARDLAGGTDAIVADIVTAINLSNESYDNSDIDQTVELVSTLEVSYTESGNGKTDRDRLQDPDDNFCDNVHDVRERESADIVVMIVENGGTYSGISYTMENPSTAFESYAFSVVQLSAAIANLSFPHEMGHIMGAEHDCEFDDGSPISYPYSHGFRNGELRTIMSVNAVAVRIECWANPDEDFPETRIPSGGTDGSSGCSAHDAQTLNNTVSIVSKFRCKHLPDEKPWCRMWSICFWFASLILLALIGLLIWFLMKRRKRI